MIRPAVHADTPALIDMVVSFFENGELDGTGLTIDRDTVEFFILDQIDLEDRAALVAEVDGQIVGGITGAVAPWWGNANVLTLVEQGWFVPAAVRESNPRVGLALLNALKSWGRSMHATVLCMSSTTRDESDRVRAMYAKQGLRLMDANYVGPL